MICLDREGINDNTIEHNCQVFSKTFSLNKYKHGVSIKKYFFWIYTIGHLYHLGD